MKDDRVYLLHIRDAVQRVQRYTADGREDFFADEKTRDAVIRNLEIIGEAAKQLSEPTRSQQADIPWKQISGMRDVLIHHYFGVKLDTVWEVVEKHLPPLAAAIDKLLSDLPTAESDQQDA